MLSKYFSVFILIGTLTWTAFPQTSGSDDVFSAVRRGDTVLVRQILQEDPLQINRRNPNGQTPLITAVAARNIEIARLLLAKGALVNCGDYDLRTPVHYANWNADTIMINLLLDHGAVVDTRAIGGASPLIHSSLNNNFGISRFLIGKGADINLQCNSLTVPLYFAVLNNNIDYLNFLIEAGAEIDIPDFLGRTPLYVAVRDGIVRAADILIRNGASVHGEVDSLGRSLLHIASIQGHPDIIELLLDAGAPVNYTDKKGFTPLDYAMRYDHQPSSSLLKSKGGLTKMPTQTMPEDHQIRIIKLQNGSWGIETEKCILIMGYSEIGSDPDRKSLLNGHITEDILDLGKEVYIVDHDLHPVKSPYSLTGSNPLLTLFASNPKVRFILNPSLYPKTDETPVSGHLKLTVIPSFGNNKCYVIELDNTKVVWLTGICNQYVPSRRDIGAIRKLVEMGIRPDILFLGSPAGIGPEFAHGIREAYLETAVLEPAHVFFFGHELLEKKILYQISRLKKNAGNICTAENPGDCFSLNQ